VNFIKKVRVGKEGAQTGIRAKPDQPSVMIRRREVLRVCVTKDAPAERDEEAGWLYIALLNWGRGFNVEHDPV